MYEHKTSYKHKTVIMDTDVVIENGIMKDKRIKYGNKILKLMFENKVDCYYNIKWTVIIKN